MARKWLPRAPIDAPAWRLVYGMIPTRSGSYYTNDVAASTVVAPSSPGTVLRAWCGLIADDTVKAWIGTTTKLWEYDGVTTFTDRSIGGGYTNTATDWSFAQFGNYTIATNRVDNIQVRDSSGSSAFADLGGTPPKARIVVTQSDAVLLFDLNDGAEKPNAFAASAPGDHTDWSGASATTATAIRHRPGKIRAAIAFRDYVVVFKRSSVYKLTYTGATNKWRVECIAIGRGAWGMHDVVNTGDELVFSGPGGVWRFDGASFRSASDWFGEIPLCDGSIYAPISGNVFFASPTVGFSCHVYNVISDTWGRQTRQTVSGAKMLTGDIAALSAIMAPTEDQPDITWFFNSGLTLVNKNTARWTGKASATFTAYVQGGAEGYGGDAGTHFGRLIPKWVYSLSSAAGTSPPANTGVELTAYFGETLDDGNLTFFTGATISARDSATSQRRFEVNRTAPYASFKMEFEGTGYSEIDDYVVEMKPQGKQPN